MPRSFAIRSILLAAIVAGSIDCDSSKHDTANPMPVASASAQPGASAHVEARAPILRREGQTLARAPKEQALYLADEDHAALRRIAITPDLSTPPPIAQPPAISFADAEEVAVALPGRPAQLVALDDRILVTIRDPGLLVAFSTGAAPKEIGRVALPADAWGLAVSPDAKTAYVTSAWTHQLSRVDLASMRAEWSITIAREPRGVTVSANGDTVYVSHLVGADITRVDVSGKPNPRRVALPPDPLRTSAGDKSVSASLGYALILSPDGSRLFVARHALGALWRWQGNPTVDVLSTVTGEPIAAPRTGKPFGQLTVEDLAAGPMWSDRAGVIALSSGSFVQPRAMIYREKTRHLLVASEGNQRLAELDAMSIAPGIIVNRYYRLGGIAPPEPTKIQIPPHCGAPTGIALSADEDVAWVHCRSTDEIVAVRLTPDGERALSSETVYLEKAAYHTKLSPWGPFAYVRLAVAPASESFALGRRLFYDAEEPVVSEEMGCAGCHPDGRDDGHVWREAKGSYGTFNHFVAGPSLSTAQPEPRPPPGVPRQTPMLAGRVKAVGPYGWRGESATLVDRIKAGFELHRSSDYLTDGATMRMRAEPLAEFLRDGLVPPPREQRELTEEEQKGKAVFESPRTQCATCHAPKSDFTDRSVVPLRGFKTLPSFEEDKKTGYKVPSLLYVGSTPPYYHDASADTLEDVVEKDLDRMGHTSHLTPEERAALVAYLKTL